MKVLFVSGELIAGDLAYRLKQEGCEVKLFIADESRQDCFENMVEKIADWKKELDWVGKDGLIVFDDIGYGKIQDELRVSGYQVVGGSEGGDKIEKDREYGQKVISELGLNNIETFDFGNVPDAIQFIKKNQKAWVLKQSGHDASLTYVGKMDDGRDVTETLRNLKMSKDNHMKLTLQKKVSGVEIGIARYFNGNDWVGPIEMNVEHKSFCNGDIGPQTGEMGTLTWYVENGKLFDATLAKAKPHLTKINFKGDVDLNCIVEEEKIHPLEFTARFGSPSTHLQAEIHLSPWKDFLLAAAQGKPFNLEYKKGFGIVVSIAIPPFPYNVKLDDYPSGAEILFRRDLTEAEMNRIHFEEVAFKNEDGKSKLCVAGANGYIIYATGFGETISAAQKEAYDLVEQIVIPKMIYRTDIGEKFANQGQALLKKWGWI